MWWCIPTVNKFCFTYSDCVVCCKLKHSLFSLEKKRKSCPCNATGNCWPKKHLYIFFLVQLLKCKTFPVIPWEVSFLCFMFFFLFLFIFYVCHTLHMYASSKYPKQEVLFSLFCQIFFLFFFFNFLLLCVIMAFHNVCLLEH